MKAEDLFKLGENLGKKQLFLREAPERTAEEKEKRRKKAEKRRAKKRHSDRSRA